MERRCISVKSLDVADASLFPETPCYLSNAIVAMPSPLLFSNQYNLNIAMSLHAWDGPIIWPET